MGADQNIGKLWIKQQTSQLDGNYGNRYAQWWAKVVQCLHKGTTRPRGEVLAICVQQNTPWTVRRTGHCKYRRIWLFRGEYCFQYRLRIVYATHTFTHRHTVKSNVFIYGLRNSVGALLWSRKGHENHPHIYCISGAVFAVNSPVVYMPLPEYYCSSNILQYMGSLGQGYCPQRYLSRDTATYILWPATAFDGHIWYII